MRKGSRTVSFVGRLSLSQRVLYQRFHCSHKNFLMCFCKKQWRGRGQKFWPPTIHCLPTTLQNAHVPNKMVPLPSTFNSLSPLLQVGSLPILLVPGTFLSFQASRTNVSAEKPAVSGNQLKNGSEKNSVMKKEKDFKDESMIIANSCVSEHK